MDCRKPVAMDGLCRITISFMIRTLTFDTYIHVLWIPAVHAGMTYGGFSSTRSELFHDGGGI